MSEIRRYDVRSKYVDHSDCEWEYEASDSGSIVFADNALTALRERDERIEKLEKAIKNLLNWYSHEMPQWESGTQKAMDDAEKLLEAK